MSWLPSADPILGDRRSCDALELVVVPRVRDLGDGFEVRRALPSERRQMVGGQMFCQHIASEGYSAQLNPPPMSPLPFSFEVPRRSSRLLRRLRHTARGRRTNGSRRPHGEMSALGSNADTEFAVARVRRRFSHADYEIMLFQNRKRLGHPA